MVYDDKSTWNTSRYIDDASKHVDNGSRNDENAYRKIDDVSTVTGQRGVESAACTAQSTTTHL